jgi:sugar-phosphatase
MVATKAARMRSIVIPAQEHADDARWSLANVKLASLNELTSAHLHGR